MGCAKMFLIILNVLTLVLSLTLLLLALLAVKATSAQTTPVYVVTGFLIGVMVLGIVGAAMESRCMLIIYIILVSVILLVTLALGIFFLVVGTQKDEALRQVLHNSSSDGLQHIINFGRNQDNSCCTCNLTTNKTYNLPPTIILPPCQGNKNATDCCQVFFDAIKDAGILIGSIFICIAFFVLVCIILSCVICCAPQGSPQAWRGAH